MTLTARGEPLSDAAEGRSVRPGTRGSAYRRVSRKLNRVHLAKLQQFYEAFGLDMVYYAKERMVEVTIRPPRRVNACVRGARCALTTRLFLPNFFLCE
ncbi:hypothetical protein A4R43_09295 [Amycolatopsis albispora]|uniref:Uncharacterized protein n=1 Tax=Amycolatopsis albispora TaxID=1804986 RepID=A0A344L3S7_9PSEU|nr:hypothetical protein A4R43_09295 [Amycolatopsis albispora]